LAGSLVQSIRRFPRRTWHANNLHNWASTGLLPAFALGNCSTAGQRHVYAKSRTPKSLRQMGTTELESVTSCMSSTLELPTNSHYGKALRMRAMVSKPATHCNYSP
jgi:hypothetical protein